MGDGSCRGATPTIPSRLTFLSTELGLVYRQLGLRLTYEPGPRLIKAEARPDGSCTKVCRRGELNPLFQHTCWEQVCMRGTVIVHDRWGQGDARLAC